MMDWQWIPPSKNDALNDANDAYILEWFFNNAVSFRRQLYTFKIICCVILNNYLFSKRRDFFLLKLDFFFFLKEKPYSHGLFSSKSNLNRNGNVCYWLAKYMLTLNLATQTRHFLCQYFSKKYFIFFMLWGNI